VVKCIYEAVIAMHTCRKWSRHDGWCLLRRNFYCVILPFMMLLYRIALPRLSS